MNANTDNADLEPIKLGRIPRAVERSHEISLSGDTYVYVSASFLEDLARKRPDSYLSVLEEGKSILVHPDFTAFTDDEVFYFCKIFYADCLFRPVYLKIVHQGKPKIWELQGIYSSGKNVLGKEKARFLRPAWKNKTQEN